MDLRDKMLSVIADVNTQFAEREELIEMIAIYPSFEEKPFYPWCARAGEKRGHQQLTQPDRRCEAV